MFPFPNFLGGDSSFRSQLESSLVRSGHNALAYAETNKFAIKQQVLAAHEDSRYTNLKRKEIDYRGDRGRKVLSLEGTIPITHENGKFNIPVEVVLPPDFPNGAPEVFVRPTDTMVISPNHPFVEAATGAVNTPSIVTWTYPRSNLTSCLTEMSAEFGVRSPVYAKPAGSTQATQSSSMQPMPNPYATSSAATATPPAATSAASAQPQNPYATSSFISNPLRASANSQATSSMYPTYPPAGAGPPARTSPGYPPSNPYLNPPPPAASTATPAFTNPYAAAASGPPPPAHPPPVGMHQSPPPARGPSKAEAAAAFRKAAIEGLTARFMGSIEQSEHLIAEETVELQSKLSKVEENRKGISDACAEKKAELRTLERNVTALSSTTQALHGWLRAHEDKITALPENPTASDVIVPVDDLSQQAIATQAEDKAIEEALEVLFEALKCGAADIEVYIKVCRELAQRQFYCRAIGAKLQQKQRERHAARPAEVPGSPQAGVLLPMGDAWSRVATYQA